MHWLSEMDMFLMTGLACFLAQVILCRERLRESERGREKERESEKSMQLIRMLWPKVTVKAHICISFDFCG